MMRVFRVFRFFRELRIVVMSILSTLRSLFWTLVLLLTVIYIFSVTILYALIGSGSAVLHTSVYFSSTGRALLTLFQATTNGIDWMQVSDELDEVSPLLSIFFVCYIT